MNLIKGIEMVRRDQCGVTVKLQEKSLRLLFSTRDLTQVRSYLISQWNKIHKGITHASIQDFIFAKEVKIGHYRGQPPPGAEVALQHMITDPRAEPPYRWRVPYIIVCGTTSSRLVDLAITPDKLLKRDNHFKINSFYYITKCINPSLIRVIGLSGANIKDWYHHIKKKSYSIRYRSGYYSMISINHLPDEHINQIHSHFPNHSHKTKKLVQKSMESYLYQRHCEICGQENNSAICQQCMETPLESYLILITNMKQLQIIDDNLSKKCNICTNSLQKSNLFVKNEMLGYDCCESIDCKIFFKRNRNLLRLEDAVYAVNDFQCHS
jgi:DNA polymerase zeta